MEYFPFGETWVQEANNAERTPYLYTSKELDEETGLYYYGARYYDPRTSVWQSPDPILEKYLPTGDKQKDAMLPSMGGVYTPINLGLYTYTHQNPVRLVDPDGKATWPTKNNEIRTGGSTGFVGYYGVSRSGGNKKHGGVDILGNKGDPVYAFEGGTVVYAGKSKKEGNMVKVKHTKVVDGKKKTYFSYYMHLDSIPKDMKKGKKVGEGAINGAMGIPAMLRVKIFQYIYISR